MTPEQVETYRLEAQFTSWVNPDKIPVRSSTDQPCLHGWQRRSTFGGYVHWFCGKCTMMEMTLGDQMPQSRTPSDDWTLPP